jgi:hypothetical protein
MTGRTDALPKNEAISTAAWELRSNWLTVGRLVTTCAEPMLPIVRQRTICINTLYFKAV